MRSLSCAAQGSALLFLGMVVGVLLSPYFPVWWGWENGPLESFQNVILLAGAAAALWGAWQLRDEPQGALWRIATMIWLVMVGRELSWGAVLLPPLDFDAITGPRFSSSVLWWKPAVKWIILAALALSAWWTVRHRLISQVIWPWMRQGLVPWSALLVFALSSIAAALAESHDSGWPWATMVAEEMPECWSYMALWWAQWCLLRPGLRAQRRI